MLYSVSFASAPAAIRSHFPGLAFLRCEAEEVGGRYVRYIVRHAGEQAEFRLIGASWVLSRKF